MVPLHREPTAQPGRQTDSFNRVRAANGWHAPGNGKTPSTEPSSREGGHGARCGVCLISLAPHGLPEGRDGEQVYEDIEKSLSKEGMPEPRCRGEEALAMQGGEGHSRGREEK